MEILSVNIPDFKIPKAIAGAYLLICLGLLCLMLYIPLLNKCFWLAILLLLFSGHAFKYWPLLFQDKIIRTGLLLVGLFTLGIFYSQGNWNYSLRTWDKYLKILYLIFFIPFFATKKTRNEAIFCVLSSVMISEIFTYLHYFNILTFGIDESKHWLFVQDIDAGFIVSFAAFIFFNLACHHKKYRLINVLCGCICTFDLLFLNHERTGYLIYFGLAGLFLMQRFYWKGLLSAILIIPTLMGALYWGSEKFHDRANLLVADIIHYHQGNNETSIGLRLAFAEYSFKVIKHHWWLGSGTGSFEQIYQSLKGPKINNLTWPAHPHNEYIAILFQLGLIGLLVFLYWLFLPIKMSFTLPQEERNLLQGAVVGFFLLGLCNASLLVNPGGACYMIFLAIFLGAKYEPVFVGYIQRGLFDRFLSSFDRKRAEERLAPSNE